MNMGKMMSDNRQSCRMSCDDLSILQRLHDEYKMRQDRREMTVATHCQLNWESTWS